MQLSSMWPTQSLREKGCRHIRANIVEYPIPLRSRNGRGADVSGIFTTLGLVKIPDNAIALLSTPFLGTQNFGITALN